MQETAKRIKTPITLKFTKHAGPEQRYCFFVASYQLRIQGRPGEKLKPDCSQAHKKLNATFGRRERRGKLVKSRRDDTGWSLQRKFKRQTLVVSPAPTADDESNGRANRC